MNTARIYKLTQAYLLAIASETGGCPSGHLYALVAMPLGASLEEHNAAVAAIKKVGMASEQSFLLTWAGPENLRLALAATMKEPPLAATPTTQC